MKKLVIFLLVIAALFYAYLAWNSSSFQGLSNAQKAVSERLSGKEANSLRENFASSSKDVIAGAKSLATQVSGAANDAIGGLVNQAENNVKEKLISILQATSSPVSPSPGQQQPETVLPADGMVQSQQSEPSVCSAISGGEQVSYGITQPFSGASGVSYNVDWGDGNAEGGTFQSGVQDVFASHSYAQQGSYGIVFTVKSSSTVLTASRSVCVK